MFNIVREHTYNTPQTSWTGTPNALEKKAFLLDAPTTVSSFMQRLGRTGRRPGAQAEMNFFCGDEMTLLRAIAVVNLARRGWIEPVSPSRRAVHVLAHQALAQALQFYGVQRDQVSDFVQHAKPFSEITHTEFRQLLDHLTATEVLQSVEGVFVLGPTGEKQYGRKNFLALYSVFETPQEVTVTTTDRRVVGALQTWFVQQTGGQAGFVFVLAGRAWQVLHLDFDEGVMVVTPAPRGAIPRWGGGGPLLGREIAQEIRAVLQIDETYPFLTPRAQERLHRIRVQWAYIVSAGPLPMQSEGRAWHLYTSAGDRINLLLARALGLLLGCEVKEDALALEITSSTHVPLQRQDISQALDTIRQPDFFSVDRVMALVRALPRGRLSEFQALLPPELEARFLAERLFDIEGLLGWIEEWGVFNAVNVSA